MNGKLGRRASNSSFRLNCVRNNDRSSKIHMSLDYGKNQLSANDPDTICKTLSPSFDLVHRGEILLEKKFNHETLKLTGGVAKGFFHNFNKLGRMIEAKFVAVKYVADPVLFENEKSILESISHENLVSFVGFYANPSRIVTELCDSNLHLFICCADEQTYKTYEMSELLTYAKEIAKGMGYLHQKEILHRDVKGSNVFLMQTFRCAPFAPLTPSRYTVKLGVNFRVY